MPIFEFEDILAQTTGAQIISPRARPHLPRGLRGLRRRISGSFEPTTEHPESDHLFVVAVTPGNLEMVTAIPNWRNRFRKVSAFVIDSFHYAGFPKQTYEFDHVFVPIPESADHIRSHFGVPTSVLSLGADCLRWGFHKGDRSIDILGVGRCPERYHLPFQAAFHTSDNSILYLHSPIGNMSGQAIWKERPMLMKVLLKSKLALAFDLFFDPPPQRPVTMPVITGRWFESLTAGCVAIGKQPKTPLFRQLFPWEDATIELPDDGYQAVDFVLSLLKDSDRLNAARQRNSIEMAARHDWRFRIQDVLTMFGIESTTTLNEQLAELDALARGSEMVCSA